MFPYSQEWETTALKHNVQIMKLYVIENMKLQEFWVWLKSKNMVRWGCKLQWYVRVIFGEERGEAYRPYRMKNFCENWRLWGPNKNFK